MIPNWAKLTTGHASSVKISKIIPFTDIVKSVIKWVTKKNYPKFEKILRFEEEKRKD